MSSSQCFKYYVIESMFGVTARKRRNLKPKPLIVVVVWHQISSVVCEGAEQLNNEYNKPSFFQLLSTSVDLLKRSHQTFSHKFKSLIHQFQLRFTPPNIDFRSSGIEKGEESESVRENMKEAMKKSNRTSEATLQGAARTAAKSVHKTADKVKKKKKPTVSRSDNQHEPRDEL
ncbi:uncharacterized protein LOC120135873 [Hibiscus syriacus]|uniref:uncharacterized protein LOC120135873 n=1 Tax=Hibiscus syriacus TaxID=106335 RepID=UPI001923FC31|nr:uncharacterized protein LOC120135873 [Hibiscus syriacus]